MDPERLPSLRRGQRLCVGAAFAMLESTLILARLIRGYDVEALNPEAVRPVTRLTTRSARGIRVCFRPR